MDGIISDKDNENDSEDEGSFSEESQYNCNDCAFQSTTQNRLRRHKSRIHIKKSPLEYECDTCKEKLADRSALLKHISQDHPNLRLCRFYLENRCIFGDKCIFKHERRAVVNFTCNVCEYEFRLKSDLMYHRKKDHPQIMMPCRKYFNDNCTIEEQVCWYRHTLPNALPINMKQDFQKGPIIKPKR